MTEQTIQSQDIKVADVFQAFYAVPDYQRESLSANLTETPAPLGITVGRWR